MLLLSHNMYWWNIEEYFRMVETDHSSVKVAEGTMLKWQEKGQDEFQQWTDWTVYVYTSSEIEYPDQCTSRNTNNSIVNALLKPSNTQRPTDSMIHQKEWTNTCDFFVKIKYNNKFSLSFEGNSDKRALVKLSHYPGILGGVS